jgi:hypothetical protein
MARIAIAVGLGLAWVLAACGGQDEAQESARKAREATEVTVESAPQAGSPTGQAAREDTQVTVESAETGARPAED